MRILISGGGTGGHVYPALAVAAALPQKSEILFVGSEHGMEKDLLCRAGVEVAFATVPAAALRGRDPVTLARNLGVLYRGTRQALSLLADFAPETILVTGGYTSIPVGLASWRRRVPLLVYLPDVVPGLAVRFLARLSTQVATTTSDSARYLPRNKMVVTGYPVRPELLATTREQARAYLGFSAAEKVLLITGGSRGARSINRAVATSLPALLERVTVVHVCGREGDEEWLAQRAAELPVELRSRYRLVPYLHDMPAFLVAADVAVCRAGASTMGELPAAGLPAVLVPYPYVHQEENADYLVRQGAAIKIPDAQMRGPDGQPDGSALLQALRSLLDEPERYSRMVEATRRLAHPNAAQALAGRLCALAGNGDERTSRQGIR